VSTDEITGGFDRRNVTRHAADRLRQRANLDRRTAARLWHNAEGLNIDRTTLDGDEARYDPIHRLVLVRKNSNLVTIIDADTAAAPVQQELATSTGWYDE